MTYRDKLAILEIEAKRRFFVLEDILIPRTGIDVETTFRIINERILFLDGNYRAVYGEYIFFYLMVHNSNFKFKLDSEIKYN